MPRAMEYIDVTKVFYKHTNPSSRLKKIRISQLVEELQES